MKSLRRQLLTATVYGMAIVLLLCGVALYALLSRTLRADFDAALAAKARSLAALFELDEDGLESELGAAALPEFTTHAEVPEYYQVWLPSWIVFARSPSLGDANLPKMGGTLHRPGFHTLPLPGGQPGRFVGVAFTPRTEEGILPPEPDWAITLVVARSTRNLEETLATLRAIMIGVGLLAVLLSAGVLVWAVRRGLRPVAHLSRQIAGMQPHDLSRRIAAAGMVRELQPVVDRLNDLLARLDAAFARERRFTGDVAHELRTPLAGMRAKLELALARDRPAETYRGTLNGCLDINLQMQRMVENLLHLARADAGQIQVRRESVDVAALARECWAPCTPRAAQRGLRIEWRVAEPPEAEVDPDALRLILQNVLDNAVTYADPAAPILVEMQRANECVHLRVSNRSDLPPEEVARVFDRFWRADPARQRQEQTRCGLGLSLCQALTKLLQGQITAEVHEAVFTLALRLPAVSTAES